MFGCKQRFVCAKDIMVQGLADLNNSFVRLMKLLLKVYV